MTQPLQCDPEENYSAMACILFRSDCIQEDSSE